MECYVGVESYTGNEVGKLVAEVTRHRVRGPFVFGSVPATHAFVAWSHHEDDTHYRLDASGEGAKLSLWAGPQLREMTFPTRLWRLRCNPRQFVQRSMDLAGSPYDYLEFAAQLLPGAEDVPPILRHAFRTFGMPDVDQLFPNLATWPLLKSALVCTSLTLEVLRAAGSEAQALADRIPNLFPERLAQSLQEASSSADWLTPV